MSVLHKTCGIILSRYQYGEADQIVVFMTEGQGRQAGIAKSSLFSSRRFGGGLEPGTIGDITYRQGRRTGLVTIEEVEVIKSAVAIMKSITRFLSAVSAIELALAFVQENEPSVEKFTLVRRFLEYVAAKEPSASDRVCFDIAWLKLVGYAPELSYCCCCGTTASQSWTLVVEAGGICCEVCGRSRRLRQDFDEAVRLKILEAIRGNPIVLENTEVQSLSDVFTDYISYILGRPLRARKIIRELEGRL